MENFAHTVGTIEWSAATVCPVQESRDLWLPVRSSILFLIHAFEMAAIAQLSYSPGYCPFKAATAKVGKHI